MKEIKNLKIKNIEVGHYGEIIKIVFESGIECLPEEDTGGEHAYLVIDGYDLKVGDVISFDYILDEYDCINNLEWIEVNDWSYRAWVESGGGNDCTYLSFSNINV